MVYTNHPRQHGNVTRSPYHGAQNVNLQSRRENGAVQQVSHDRESVGFQNPKFKHRQQTDREAPDDNRKAKITMRYAGLSIRRVAVASTNRSVCRSTTLLKFRPCAKTSLPHLSQDSLYTLAVDESLSDLKGKGNGRNLSADLSDNCQEETRAKHLSSQEVAEHVTEKLRPYMSEALEYVRSYLESRFWAGIKPKLLIRFGKMLFHSRHNKFNLTEKTPFDEASLEKFLFGSKEQQGSALKSFDGCLPQKFHKKVRDVLGNGREDQFVTTEKFVIQIEDTTNPQISLMCICKRNLNNDDKSRLTLCKIYTAPLRHMVADIACIDKECDLRLILTTKQDFSGRQDFIQTIVNKAVYNVKAPGGLYWPLGSTSAGPYRVTGISQLLQTGIVVEGRKWKMRHVNRTSGGEVKGNYSFEMDLVAQEWPQQFQVWKESYQKQSMKQKESYQKQSMKQNSDYTNSLVKPLPSLLGWIWENCI